MGHVLVLGGTTFLGPHIVRDLARRGHTVCVFHRGENEAEFPPTVRHVHGSFAAFSEHVEELRAFAPDVVIDTVPYIDKNGQGIAHFAGVARRAVVVTSGDVYRAFARIWGSEPGPPEPMPLTEEAPLRAKPAPDLTTDIDYDNVEVERMVARSEVPTTVMRAPIIFGPADPLRRLRRYLQRMDDDRPAIVLDAGLAEMRFSRGYVQDVGHAVALAASDPSAEGRTYNVGPGRTLTEHAWVAAIAEAHGWRGKVVPVPTPLLPEQLRVPFNTEQNVILDSSRIRRELSYEEEVSLHDALVRTIEWERSNPPSVASPSFDYDAEDRVLASYVHPA